MAALMTVTKISLQAVSGFGQLRNDIFFYSCGGQPTANVILFCGDVQNEKSIMNLHPHFAKYAENWSFDAVAELVLKRLRDSGKDVHLWIIRASRWVDNVFAFYDNFIRHSSRNAPDYSKMNSAGGKTFNAWRHLDALMKNAMVSLEGTRADLPFAILGFSKGCSVLTQLIYELGMFSNLPQFSRELRLPSRVLSMTWLDSGHSGLTHLWPTWVQALARLPLCPSLPKLFAFATPYELCVDRPWNYRDFNTFIEILQSLEIPIVFDTLYKRHHWDYSFEVPPPALRVGIEAHFEIFESFPIQLCIPPSTGPANNQA